MTCGVVGSASCEQVWGHQWHNEDRDAKRAKKVSLMAGVKEVLRRRWSLAAADDSDAWSSSFIFDPSFVIACFVPNRRGGKVVLAEFYFLEEISGSSTQEKKREILMEADDPAASFPLAKWRSDFSRAFQYYLDKSTPHTTERWIGTAGFAVIYCLRVYLVQGFYIVSYGLGIYLLNLLIGFLSPLVDPEIEVSDGLSLPTRGSDEFKPFVRRLPEFKFCLWHLICGCVVHCAAYSFIDLDPWYFSVTCSRDFQSLTLQHKYILSSISVSRYSITKAFCVAFVMTFFSVFDVPVFWPILLCYWVVLFCLTMKRQITHMIKYKYVPFNLGKQVSFSST
ncbi:hypothetical protein ZIOFF_037387 [Zingiber officinale]|uniref:Uncharacterized protein n=1 Tax=Zingiber officinale TaxID=94328 RepID=A0A8J5GJH4_ZINOF|nr:hypothetical protein ZIOFF_037387 [Zingiber officinale]